MWAVGFITFVNFSTIGAQIFLFICSLSLFLDSKSPNVRPFPIVPYFLYLVLFFTPLFFPRFVSVWTMPVNLF